MEKISVTIDNAVYIFEKREEVYYGKSNYYD